MAEGNGELAETKPIELENENNEQTAPIEADHEGQYIETAGEVKNEVEKAIDIIGFDGIAQKYSIDPEYCTSEHFFVEYDEVDNPWLIPKKYLFRIVFLVALRPIKCMTKKLKGSGIRCRARGMLREKTSA